MLGKLVVIDNIAYYSVAVFIATVIAVPARAMHQITHPLTAKFLNENKLTELEDLYRRSSLNLFIVGGLVFVLILTNINTLYEVLPADYEKGLFVVIIISLVKLMDNVMGNINAILFNSDYYRMILVFGLIIVGIAVILNLVLIPEYGINGAAVATFIAFLIYNILKLCYVYLKFKMQPFTKRSFYVLLMIALLSFGFYFWDFPVHPILSIAIKALIIGIIYVGSIFRFRLSEDINSILSRFFKLF